MPIISETNDWGWVLERPCDECGFDSSRLGRDQVGPLIRTNAQSWQVILARPRAQLSRRLREDRWSPLEYACHVRDVLLLFDERLELMLRVDIPRFPYWDQDQAALDAQYHDQDPIEIAPTLAAASNDLAWRFGQIKEASWERRGIRSDGFEFTVDTLGCWVVRDGIHHLHDVTTDLSNA